MNPGRRLLLNQALEKALEDNAKLRSKALQSRIIINQRIACLKYTLGYEEKEILKYLHESSDYVPELVKHRSIEPSLALAVWGICGIIKRNDIIDTLSRTDPERLGSQHGPPRYTKMMASIFRANQAAWHNEKNIVQKEIEFYDRENTRKRTNRVFAKWITGLRNLHATWAKNESLKIPIDERQKYLLESYDQTETDHEGILDVHGIGIITSMHLSGYRTEEDRNPFPIKF